MAGAIVKQTWILTKKTLLVVFVRHWFFTSVRAFWAPIIFMFFITYAKNFFVPPSEYGIGAPSPIRSFPNALAAAQGGRDKVVFVNNGFTGGDIEQVIGQISNQVRDAGLQPITIQQDVELLSTCESSLRGASTCFGAVSFHSSPSEGQSWNYTIRSDGALGEEIYVAQDDNDVQIYILPFQRAIDQAIVSVSGSATVPDIDEYPYTERTQEEYDDRIRTLYMGALINIMGVALYIGVCGVTYQLTGQMAEERERGISQLVEAMSPAKKAWHTQFARLLSMHIAFDIIYFPGWVIMGAIVWALAFQTSNAAILVIFHILAGLSMTSFSIFGAAFFRKAQLSGITIVIVPILLAIIAQVAGPFSTAAVYVLSLLFPSINYVFFIICVARFERQLIGMNLVGAAPDYEDHIWTTPGIVFWIFAIIQTIVFPVLGALVERWLYGTVSADRKTTTSSPDHNIILTNFSKHWTPSWFRRNVLTKFGVKPPETVIAVDNFSMKARKGQIMVLLGANGSGKSTTLDAIAGLNSITSGAIEIDGTGGLGLCPQKNVMWDELNVYEHVRIFNQLKSTGSYDTKDTIEDLIRACDLGHKIKAQSCTLSGGQKRKLQLAMMFTGGSKVCCVDEVSSGLDPLSRRKIWEILLAERGDRTFLLTTHFLDEADVLADYVAILSRGVLKTKGTSVQLKHEVGAGYHVTYPKDAPIEPPVGAIKKPSPSEGMVQYQFEDALPATKFVDILRDHGVKNYDIVGPTLEDVFLANAEEVKEYNLMDADHVEPTGLTASDKNPDVPSEHNSDIDKRLDMGKGRGTGLFKQMLILVQKRVTIVKRNFWPYVFALLLPIAAAGLVTLFLKDYEAVGCDPGANANDPTIFSLSNVDDIPLIPIGPRSTVGRDIDTIIQRTGIPEGSFYIVDTLDQFNDFVNTRFRNITPGGFFLNENSPPVMAYLANGGVIGGLVTLNTLDNILTNTTISTQYQQFAVPFAPNMGDTLQLILYFGLAMCVYPALFALYPTQERLRNVRALHYSNGIRAVPLWLAYTAFDFLFVLVISAVTTGIFVSASDAWYAPGYLFVVFFLYGLCATLFAYLISIVVTSQLAAFAFAAGGMVSLYLIYFIGYMAILTYAPAYAIDSYIEYFHWTVSLISPSASLLRTQLLSLNSFSVLCDGNQIPSYPGALTVYGGPILYLVVQIILLFIALVWWDSGYRPAFLNREKSRQQHSEETVDTVPLAVAAEITRAEQSKDSLRALHLQKTFGSNHAVNDITFGIPQGQVFALLGPNGAGKSSTISLIRGDIHPTTHINGGGDVLIEDISIISKRAAARGHLGVCPQFDAMDSMTVTEHLYFYARARGVPDPKASVDAILQATSLGRFHDRLASKLSGGNKRKLSLGIALMGNPSVLLLDEPSSGMDAAAKRVMWRTLLGVAAPGRALLITTHSMEEADKLATRVGIMKRRMLALGTVSDLGEQYGDAWVVQLVLKSAPETTEEEMEAVKQWVQKKIPGVQLDKWGSRGGGHGQLRFKVLKAASPDSTASPAHLNKAQDGKITEAEVHQVNTMSSAASASDLGGIPGLIQLLETNRHELGLEYYSVSPTTLDEVFLRVVGEEEEETSGKKPEGTKRSQWGRFICCGLSG